MGLRTQVTVYEADRRSAQEAVDISVGGLSLKAPSLGPVGTFVRLNFRVADGGPWVDVDGVVRHVREANDGYTHGIEFVGAQRSIDCVRQLVEEARDESDSIPVASPRELHEVFRQALRELR